MKTLALHILDITENSVKSGAGIIEIKIHENPEKNIYSIEIKDNGAGMDKETLERVTDPYYTTKNNKKVGMGLSLLKQNAEQTGGSLNIQSEKNKGTIVRAEFGYNHIDLADLGDIAGVITMLIVSHSEKEFIYTHTTPEGEFTLDSRELKQTMEGISLSDASVQTKIKEMINENLHTLKIHS